MTAARRCLVVAILCMSGATACTSLRPWISRDESQRRAERLQEAQLKVMRYADEYGGRLIEPLERLATAVTSPEERLAGQTWQLTQATAAYTIASGANPRMNVLDMVVLAALSRSVVERHWVGGQYGERAAPLLEVHRALEVQAWTLCGGVLQPDQITYLRAMIEEWRSNHPHVREVAQVRFRDFTEAASGSSQRGTQSGGGLFSLLGLDPLRNLDPAVREIEQTRQLAERTIYYMQRAPDLLDMQIERLVYQLAVMPETQAVLLDTERFGLAAAALGRLADDLPATLASEREALRRQLDALLVSPELRDLLGQIRATLQAGAEASTAAQDSVIALTTLVERMKPARTPADAAPRKPFDISEYAATAHEISQAMRELQRLLTDVDPAAAAKILRSSVDHAFWRCAQLIALVLAASLLFAAVRARI